MEYKSAARNAKEISEALKERFPGFNFSVSSRSYRGGGGNGITVHWIDGPSKQRVELAIGGFPGVGRDENGYAINEYPGRYVIIDRDYSREAIAWATEQTGYDPDRDLEGDDLPSLVGFLAVLDNESWYLPHARKPHEYVEAAESSEVVCRSCGHELCQ